MSVTIDYDRRAGRWRFLCGCGWNGDTSNLNAAAAPLAEHTRVCDGHRGNSKPTRYDVDSHAAGRAAELNHRRREQIKLTVDDVREIRRRHDNGETHKAIAQAVGTTVANVDTIVHRRTWADVE